MNSSLGITMGSLAIAVLSGCVIRPPAQIRTAPLPTPQEIALKRQEQSRVIAVPLESVFPKVLDVLMDNGFIVRSVNEKAGFVSFSQQWQDKSWNGVNITIEGSLLFRSAGTNSTQVRVALTGSLEAFSCDGVYSSTSMVRDVQQNASAKEYQMVLDVIDHGLASGN